MLVFGTGKRFIRLEKDPTGYSYVGTNCGGGLPEMSSDDSAIEYMERPWGQFGAGPATVMATDNPSLKRVL